MKTDSPNLKELVHNLRTDYSKTSLERNSARENPFEQFELWFAAAVEKKLHEPNAMVLSTATKDGKPSLRIVLLRGFDESGFVFYTNYKSRKGLELKENPHAAILFYWAEIERQVRVEGTIEKKKKIPTLISNRARAKVESAPGASPQSSVIENRKVLEKKFNELARQWEGKNIVRPQDWGGYALKPEVFEFWQGRESRLHDRLLYTKTDSAWKIERLAP